MAGAGANQSHQLVTLNGTADLSAPLAGLVICCTSVPDEKRVSIPGSPRCDQATIIKSW